MVQRINASGGDARSRARSACASPGRHVPWHKCYNAYHPESMRLLIINARSCLSAKGSSSYDYVPTSVDIRVLKDYLIYYIILVIIALT